MWAGTDARGGSGPLLPRTIQDEGQSGQSTVMSCEDRDWVDRLLNGSLVLRTEYTSSQQELYDYANMNTKVVHLSIFFSLQITAIFLL